MNQVTIWRRAREIFEELSDQAGAVDGATGALQDLEARLSAACGDDTSLRAAVESLLAADRHPTLAPKDLVETLEGALDWQRTGPSLGPYRIVDRIAQGGMGVVFLGERADGQFEKKVAIKLLRTEVRSSPELRRRFEVERQVLASLQHPNIAHLLDGGVAQDGTPFLVMEYIDGQPITAYCDEHRLEVRQRLELLLQVAEAVHHAHQRLIVHRDLKPSNILVGAEGRPKLLDFGIAKLLAGSPMRDGETATETSGEALTPSYASPEQLAGETLTTATDLYSLAVVAFHLVVGVPPFPPESPGAAGSRLQALPPLEALARHGVGAEAFEALARARGIGAGAWRRTLGSDLQKILLKALRPEPERRYASVERFADDLRAYLEGRPVTARRPRLTYRSKKLLQRNPMAAAATTLALALAVYAGASQIQKERTVARERDLARGEQRRAETVTAFLLSLFDQASPGKTPSASDTAEEILGRGAARIEDQLRDQPLVRATLIHTIGQVYRRLGLYDRALELATQGLEERREILGPEDPAVAESLSLLGLVHFSRGELAEAEGFLSQAVVQQKKALPDSTPALAATLLALGGVLRRSGDFDQARFVLEEALSIEESLHLAGDRPRKTGSVPGGTRARDDAGHLISALSNLAMLETTVDRIDKAELLLARAVNLGGAETTRLSLAAALNNLSVGQFKQGKVRGARTSADQSRALRQGILGANHPVTQLTAFNVGIMDLIQGEYVRADALFVEIEGSILAGGDSAPALLARVVGGQAGAAELTGDAERGRQLYGRFLELSEDAFGGDNWRHSEALYPVGRFLLNHGEAVAGCRYLERALALQAAQFGEGARRLARTMALLARCAPRAGEEERRGRLLQKALALVPNSEDRTPKSDLDRASVLLEWGRWQREGGDSEKAQEAWNEVVVLLRPWVQGEVVVPYVRLRTTALLHLGRFEEAARGAETLFARGFRPVDFVELMESFGLKASPAPAS